MALARREPRKKYTDVESAPEIPLYLITTGPAKNIWAMATMSKKELVELIPIFDTEECVSGLLKDLQDKTYQSTTVSLNSLSSLVKERKALFILNPNIKIQDGQMSFKEGPNWHLPFERLSSLLLVEPTKEENQP